jgi:hypothetical protein
MVRQSPGRTRETGIGSRSTRTVAERQEILVGLRAQEGLEPGCEPVSKYVSVTENVPGKNESFVDYNQHWLCLLIFTSYAFLPAVV